MAYPNLSEGDEGVKIELNDPTGEEEKQIGFDGLSEKATTPISESDSTMQLLAADKPETRPRLNTAERVSILLY